MNYTNTKTGAVPKFPNPGAQYLWIHDPDFAQGRIDMRFFLRCMEGTHARLRPRTEAAAERCDLIAAIGYCWFWARERGATAEELAHIRELHRVLAEYRAME